MATATETAPAAEQQNPAPAVVQPAAVDTSKDEPKGITDLNSTWHVGIKRFAQNIGAWAKHNRNAAIGAAVGTGVLVTILAAAYPLWKKVIKPRLAEMKKKKAAGRYAKRSADDEIIDELLQDEEFLSWLEDVAVEFE
jgi:hypothetical protein